MQEQPEFAELCMIYIFNSKLFCSLTLLQSLVVYHCLIDL